MLKSGALEEKNKAFTLLELMVVIIILSVLATLAIPQFIVPKERALDNEAKLNLKLIQVAERIYRIETGAYIVCADVTCLNTNLKLSLSSTYWRYAADLTGGLSIMARRNNPPSASWDRDFWIDNDNNEACCCTSDQRCLSKDWCTTMGEVCQGTPVP